MGDKITIKRENVLNAYKQSPEEHKVLLENIFGKEMFNPKNIIERVKTFEDAVAILGKYNKAVIDYYALSNMNCADDILAFAKLKIITEVLNEGWKPTFDEKEWRHYAWFYIYTKAEYDILDDDKKEACYPIIHSSNVSDISCDISYISGRRVSTASYSYCGSMLALKTQELAYYCANQFIDIWADFLFAQDMQKEKNKGARNEIANGTDL